MIKRILSTFLSLMMVSFLIGQNNKNVWRTWYITAKDGKVKQLEKGLAEHVAKFHGPGSWPEYYFDILSGPNAGSLMGFSGPHTWKDFDDRERSQADVDHWNKYVLPNSVNNNSIDFWVFSPDLTYEEETNEYFHISYNYLTPGTDAEYVEFLEAVKKTKEANKSPVNHEIYKVVSGKNPDTWVWLYPMKNMEELNGSTQIVGGGLSMASVLGEKEAKRLNKIYQKVVKSRMREIIKSRPDLSTSSNNN